MSNGPITRDPDEITRISKSEYDFRVEVLRALERIETTVRLHTIEDDKRFEELGRKFSGVSSSVGSIDKDRSKLMGIWIGVSSVILALFAIVTAWWKR